MIVCITGGSGFVGTHLVNMHLSCGDEVRLLTRKTNYSIEGAKVFLGDLTKEEVKLNDFLNGADILYHCAGEINNEKLMHSLHVDGTKKLIKSAYNKINRWVQLSSVGAYGPHRDGVITEKTIENPINLYEKTKTISDKIVKESGLPYVIIRPSAIFGNNMSNQSIFQMCAMIQNRYFIYLGKPNPTVNYIHVDDVVNGMMRSATHVKAVNQTYIINQSLFLEQMVEKLMEGMNCKNKIIRLPVMPFKIIALLSIINKQFPLTYSRIAAMTNRVCYDSMKINKELNFVYESTLEERFLKFSESLKVY